MNHSTKTRILSKVRAVAALSAISIFSVMTPPSRVAEAQVVVEYPPAAYLATVEPFYYENHATYWYRNHWRYRDGRGWHMYDTEPPFLASRRFRSAPGRWYYGGGGWGRRGWRGGGWGGGGRWGYHGRR
jgi:hypothetical protein